MSTVQNQASGRAKVRIEVLTYLETLVDAVTNQIEATNDWYKEFAGTCIRKVNRLDQQVGPDLVHFYETQPQATQHEKEQDYAAEIEYVLRVAEGMLRTLCTEGHQGWGLEPTGLVGSGFNQRLNRLIERISRVQDSEALAAALLTHP